MRNGVYYGLWAAWGLIAFPFSAISIFMFGSIPMWPEFGNEATIEGAIIWAALTAWVYFLPVGLITTRRWWHDRNDIVEN